MKKEIFDFYLDLMNIESTSGREAKLSEYIKQKVNYKKAKLEVQQVGDGSENLFFKWGDPKIIFCTHMDTVPPYIPPTVSYNIDSDLIDDATVWGRGACDAKGQIVSQYALSLELEKEGYSDFGILWVSGEETGSTGARQANQIIDGCEYIVVGEPTENLLVSAAKGTALYKVKIEGRGAHSGYPLNGDDALIKFNDFYRKLRDLKFPVDKILGDTTWNIGVLSSPNPFNVVPYLVEFSLYVRTTFASEKVVDSLLQELSAQDVMLLPISKSNPIMFHTEQGFQQGSVSFGSDAPLFTNVPSKLLYGPGSILNAHTESERLTIKEIEKAVEDLQTLYLKLKERIV